VGLLQVANKKTDYSEKDVALFQTIGNVIAPILDARLQREREEQTRRKAEEALEKTVEALAARQAELQEVHHLAHLGVWNWDLRADVVTWNDELFHISGLEPGQREPTFAELPRFYAPESWERLKTAVDRALHTGEPYNLQLEGIRPDGTSRWTDAWGGVVRDSTGQIVGLRGTVRDVTEHRRTEGALRQASERLQEAQRVARLGIWEWNPGKDEISGSPEFFRLFDCEPAQMARYEQFLGSLHPDDRLRVENDVTDALKLDRPYDTEYRVRLHDGRWRDLAARGQVMLDDRARPTRLVGTCLDITERKLAEAALRASEERTQKEREALLARLAQSDRLTSMGMLAAGVAHEINNPLSYVLFHIESLIVDLPKLADLMRRCHDELSTRIGQDAVAQALGDDQKVFNPAMFSDALGRLREALAGALRIRRISRSLSTFSQGEHTEIAPVDVKAAVEHAVTMAFNEIKYRARLVKDFSSVPAVLASDGKLAQVFLNLLVNAAHAIDEGRLEHNEIRVRVWADGDMVCAEVSDTGKGIAPEHRDRIFEPFFTTKGVGVGTGLGLSICRNIVTGFGGTISFTSEVGKGTRFSVKLPRLPRDWSKRDNRIATAAVSPPVRGRILIVDDEDGVREILCRMLGRQHDLVAVSSGEEARTLLERDRQFDVLLVDLVMPRMSGMELHARLHSEDPALADRVVFMTGGAFTAGAADYLAKVKNTRVEKPFDTIGFPRLVDQLVLAARSTRGSACSIRG
ncbi:MAG: PAS domain-containing protein, partial [Pseudomonadota bacterium]